MNSILGIHRGSRVSHLISTILFYSQGFCFYHTEMQPLHSASEKEKNISSRGGIFSSSSPFKKDGNSLPIQKEETSRKRRLMCWLIPCVVVLALIILITILYFLLNRGKKETNAPTSLPQRTKADERSKMKEPPLTILKEETPKPVQAQPKPPEQQHEEVVNVSENAEPASSSATFSSPVPARVTETKPLEDTKSDQPLPIVQPKLTSIKTTPPITKSIHSSSLPSTHIKPPPTLSESKVTSLSGSTVIKPLPPTTISSATSSTAASLLDTKLTKVVSSSSSPSPSPSPSPSSISSSTLLKPTAGTSGSASTLITKPSPVITTPVISGAPINVKTILVDQPYHVVIEAATLENIKQYLTEVQGAWVENKGKPLSVDTKLFEDPKKKPKPGYRFRLEHGSSIGNIKTPAQLLDAILKCRQPNITGVQHQEWWTRWNHREATILGDLSIIVHAQALDDGSWFDEKNGKTTHKQHTTPIPVVMGFVCGCLGMKYFPDYDEFQKDKANTGCGLEQIMTRRLLPVFRSFSGILKSKYPPGTRSLVTMNAIGCGKFSNDLKDEKLTLHFVTAIRRIHAKYGHQFANLDIWLDFFDSKITKQEDGDNVMGAIKDKGAIFLRHRMDRDQPGLPPLCHPSEYAKVLKQAYNIDRTYGELLFTTVANDHFAYPCNDWIGGNRKTDDGNKGAATNCVQVLTGLKGGFVDSLGFKPPKPAGTWQELIIEHKIKLTSLNRTLIYDRKQNDDYGQPLITS